MTTLPAGTVTFVFTDIEGSTRLLQQLGDGFADARIPAAGAAVRVDGKDVGRVTSPVVSPAAGRGIALGILRREHEAPGTPVEVAGGDGVLAAKVAPLPFYRRTA